MVFLEELSLADTATSAFLKKGEKLTVEYPVEEESSVQVPVVDSSEEQLSVQGPIDSVLDALMQDTTGSDKDRHTH